MNGRHWGTVQALKVKRDCPSSGEYFQETAAYPHGAGAEGVSSNIIKTLMEREWIRVLGHREVPGRPALYGTTREFLDHFGLKGLEGLPPLAEIRDLDQVAPDLFAPAPLDQDLGDTEATDGDSLESSPGSAESAGSSTEEIEDSDGDASAMPHDGALAGGGEDEDVTLLNNAGVEVTGMLDRSEALKIIPSLGTNLSIILS